MNVFTELLVATGQYVESSIPEIAQAAWQVKQLTEQFQDGQLSRQEYEELVVDTLDLNRVVSLMETQERRQEIAQVLEIIKNHLGGILSLVI